MDSSDAYLILSLLPNVGPIRVSKLLSHFKSPEAILTASRAELIKVQGIGPEMAETFVDWENRVDLEEEKRRMADRGIALITWDSENYPKALREIHDPPFLLFIKGKILPQDAQAIGVVGSRRTTHYGSSAAKQLSYQLAGSGFTIISGLARGIDTHAHEAALAAGGRTIAVLGSGVGNIYPPQNQALADRIAENGAVISEFPVLYVPDKKSFPMRNRIVAGMSLGLLVVEAPARSGSLITANQALDQGRPVFAVPGPIDRATSEGCNRLIQAGAKLVLESKDVIEEFEYSTIPQLEFDFDSVENKKESVPKEAGGDAEQKILDLLKDENLTIDTLVEQSRMPLPMVSAALIKLEMKSQVKQLPGKIFTKLV